MYEIGDRVIYQGADKDAYKRVGTLKSIEEKDGKPQLTVEFDDGETFAAPVDDWSREFTNACTSMNSVVRNAMAANRRVARNAEPIRKEWGRDVAASARINPAGGKSYEVSIYTDGITSGYSSNDSGKECLASAKRTLAVLDRKASALKQAIAWMEQNFPKL